MILSIIRFIYAALLSKIGVLSAAEGFDSPRRHADKRLKPMSPVLALIVSVCACVHASVGACFVYQNIFFFLRWW